MAASNVPYPCIASANVGDSATPVFPVNAAGRAKLAYCQAQGQGPELGIDEDAGTLSVPAVFAYTFATSPTPTVELRLTFTDASTQSLWATAVWRVVTQSGFLARSAVSAGSAAALGSTSGGEHSAHLVQFGGPITAGKTIGQAEVRVQRAIASTGTPSMTLVALAEPLASYFNGTDGTKPLDNADLLNDLFTTATYTPPNPPPTCTQTVESLDRRTVTISITGGDDSGLASGSVNWGDGQTTTLTPAELTTIKGGGAVTQTHTYAPAGGTFGVMVMLTDTGGASTTSTPTSVVISPNTAPTCAFTATVQPDNRTVVLNATASVDADGTIVAWRYRPDVDGAPTNWQTGALGQSITFTYPAHGVYLLEVEVTDHEGAVDTQQAILDATNVPPVAQAVLFRAGQQVTLVDASVDVDGDISSVWVTWGDGTLPEPLAPGTSWWHTYPVTTTTRAYTVTLDVVDDDGATARWTGALLLPGLVATPETVRPWDQSPGIVVVERVHARGEG